MSQVHPQPQEQNHEAWRTTAEVSFPSMNRPAVLFVALLVFVHGTLLWLMLTRQLDPLFNDAKHRLGPGTDFAAYYYAGIGVLSGKGAYGHGPGFGFRYHPLFAGAIGIFFGGMSISSAYIIWCILHEIGFFWIWTRLPSICTSRREFILLSTFLVFFSPYYLEVYMGNASFLSSVILFQTILLISRNRHLAATILLVFSIIVKPIGIVLLSLQIIQGRWRSTAAIGVLFMLSAVPFFWKNLQALYHVTFLNLAAIPMKGWVVHGGNQGLHAFVVNLCARIAGIPVSQLSSYSELPQYSLLLVYLLPLLLVVLSFAASFQYRNRTYLLAFLWFSTYLLGYKDVWEHSYSICIVVLLCAWMSDFFPRRLLLLAALLMALPTAFVFYDLALPAGPNDPERYWSHAVSIVHHSTKPAAILLPYAYAIWKALLEQKAPL